MCVLTVIVVLYVGLRRHKDKEALMSSKEDIRDNVIHYDDEGGGEEDTHAFDMGTLRNPKAVKETALRRDVRPDGRSLSDLARASASTAAAEDSEDIRTYIHQRLMENHASGSTPPYDSLATYAYEGEGSVAESLSSIESWGGDPEEEFKCISDWGPRFKMLAGLFEEQDAQATEVSDNKDSH